MIGLVFKILNGACDENVEILIKIIKGYDKYSSKLCTIIFYAQLSCHIFILKLPSTEITGKKLN